MAVIAFLFGGVLGFFSGMLALMVGTGFVMALLLWVTVGLAAATLVALFALLPRRRVVAEA